MPDFDDSQITGTKWEILKELSLHPLSPKQLAENMNTTIANMSQQLKLLEAYGYVKSKRVDKGVGGRAKNDGNRIIYYLSKNTSIITIIGQHITAKKEIKLTPYNLLIFNTIMADLKEEGLCILKFCLVHENLLNVMDALLYIKHENAELHLLVITENPGSFRNEKSSIQIECPLTGKKTIKFWSHTIEEFKAGLSNKEKYFLEQHKNSVLLYEKKPGYLYQSLEGLK